MASLILAALFLLAMTLFLRGASDRFEELLHGDRFVSTSFGLRWPSLKVDALTPGAERAGLRKGDIVLGVNGHAFPERSLTLRRLRQVPHALVDFEDASALVVGGDYYDFIPMSEGGLGIAIGDISGKGIPAALLMASLRAFLRGQAIDHETDLSAVIAKLNRLVFESSAENRYATFFWGRTIRHPVFCAM